MDNTIALKQFHQMILDQWWEPKIGTKGEDKIKLDQVIDWFFTYGIPDPKDAAEKWAHWITKMYPKGKEKPVTMRKKVFTLALGIHETSCRHYFSGIYKQEKLVSLETRRRLDFLMRFTGQQPPIFEEKYEAPKEKKRDYIPPIKRKKIALITQLNDLASLPYHNEIMKGLVAQAEENRYNLKIYEAKAKEPDKAMIRAILNDLPDGIILIRLKPSRKMLSMLEKSPIPIVLIHSGEQLMPSPIVGNVESVLQEGRNPNLKLNFLKWLQKTRRQASRRGKVVIVHMPLQGHLHRKKRVDYISRIISTENLEIEYHEVNNYSFDNAYEVWARSPRADLYMCLSDQIAVSLKNILQAVHSNGFRPIIVGFDGSPLAIQHGICSFNQKLDQVGVKAFERLKIVIQKGYYSGSTEIPIHVEFLDSQVQATKARRQAPS